MTIINKYLAYSAIAGTLLALTGCIIAPPNPNNRYSSPDRSGYRNDYSQVDISDLRTGSTDQAERQLYDRGFNRVGGAPGGYNSGTSDSVWFNSRTNQCFQMIGSNGKVSTIMSRNPGSCKAP